MVHILTRARRIPFTHWKFALFSWTDWGYVNSPYGKAVHIGFLSLWRPHD